jgi:hypothetical protein
VATVLGLSPGIGYLSEPFNPDIRPILPHLPVDLWFPYVVEGDVPPGLASSVAKRLRFGFPLLNELKSVRSVKASLKLVRNYEQFARYRRARGRPLVKDPIALLSTEWLAAQFGAKPVLMVRHPAAFVGSLRIRRETFDFNNFLRQDRLMEEVLSPFARRIENSARHRRGPIEEGALLWTILNTVVFRMKMAHQEWPVMRHEDLCADPISGFRGLFQHFGIEYTERAQRVVEEYSDPRNTVEGNGPADVHRNSSATRWTWHRRLTTDDVMTVRREVGESAEYFYGPDEW